MLINCKLLGHVDSTFIISKIDRIDNKINVAVNRLYIRYQDTWLCVVWPSSGVWDIVCYLHKPTFSHFQLFIELADFTKSHLRCSTVSLPYIFERNWPSSYVVLKVTQISTYFSSSQHKLIHYKTLLIL